MNFEFLVLIAKHSNTCNAVANPPFKGKCDLAFATDHQKWRLATQILKGEVCGGFLCNKEFLVKFEFGETFYNLYFQLALTIDAISLYLGSIKPQPLFVASFITSFSKDSQAK